MKRKREIGEVYDRAYALHTEAVGGDIDSACEDSSCDFEKLGQACALYRSVLEDNQTDIDARTNLGHALFLLGRAGGPEGASRLDEARACFEAVIRHDTSRRAPATVSAQVGLGTLLVFAAENGGVDPAALLAAAERCYEAALVQQPGDPEVLLLSAHGHLAALKLKIDPDGALARGRARVHAVLGAEVSTDDDPEALVLDAALLLERAEQLPEGRRNLEKKVDLLSRAVEQLRAALALEPDDAVNVKRQLASAMSDVGEALAEGGVLGQGHRPMLGFEEGQTVMPEQVLMAAAELRADDLPSLRGDTWMALARVRGNDRGTAEHAVKAYTEAIAADREDGTSYYNLACSLAMMSGPQAISEIREALKEAMRLGAADPSDIQEDQDLASVRDIL